MYKKYNNVIYHSELEMNNYYYSSRIDEVGMKLSKLLTQNEKIHFFPDATLKSNKFPNGIAIYSPFHEATLIPFLLRDPGCGFLIFKIHTNDVDYDEVLKSKLHEFGVKLETNKFDVLHPHLEIKSFLESIIYYGLREIDLSCRDRFDKTQFALDQSCINISDDDFASLYNELNNITNTIEIKKIIDFNIPHHLKNNFLKSGDIIGFIHSGTDLFPKIIDQLFFQKIADYSYLNGMATVEEINSGLYGVPLANEIGYAHYQWVKAAMNYCLYKRWSLFNVFAKFIKHNLNLEVEMLNDRIHAGAFQKKINGQEMLIQTRGVQEFSNSNEKNKNYYLLAGQRETISFILTPNTKIQDSIDIGHGTSYAIDNSYNYTQLLGEENAQAYVSMCDKISSNTNLQKQTCLAHTYNIISQLKYLIDQNYCSSVSCLMPLANYMGKSLLSRLVEKQ